MTLPQDKLPKIPPFVGPKPKPPRKNGVDTRGMLSIVSMLVSLAALTASMIGAGWSMRYYSTMMLTAALTASS